jgi:hypothetical protein
VGVLRDRWYLAKNPTKLRRLYLGGSKPPQNGKISKKKIKMLKLSLKYSNIRQIL